MRPYSKTQILLHWAVALLIAAQFVFHESIADAWRAFQRGQEVVFDPLVAAHVFGGIAILLLVVWRLVIRARAGAVPPEVRQQIAEVRHPRFAASLFFNELLHQRVPFRRGCVVTRISIMSLA